MKKFIWITLFVSMGLSSLNAAYFICNDYKRNLYVELWQSRDNNEMAIYNRNGRKVDHLYVGRAKAGNWRYYGKSTTIYVYKNKRQFSIRSYYPRSNRTGPIFGVFNCYRR
jgi:hypothetical protein